VRRPSRITGVPLSSFLIIFFSDCESGVWETLGPRWRSSEASDILLSDILEDLLVLMEGCKIVFERKVEYVGVGL